jgi:outer membrane protein OmpA-like peptidoglycan-associated protein
MKIMKIALLALTLLVSTDRPVVVPGPVCAVLDGHAVPVADGLRIGEEAYFRPACGGELRSDLLFEFNSSRLKPGALELLGEWARIIQADAAPYRIEGHTDWIGSERYNMSLSLRRAEAVRQALVMLGIPAERLAVQGFGKSRPVADNRLDEGRARNRRVELMRREEKTADQP